MLKEKTSSLCRKKWEMKGENFIWKVIEKDKKRHLLFMTVKKEYQKVKTLHVLPTEAISLPAQLKSYTKGGEESQETYIQEDKSWRRKPWHSSTVHYNLETASEPFAPGGYRSRLWDMFLLQAVPGEDVKESLPEKDECDREEPKGREDEHLLEVPPTEREKRDRE